MRMALVEVIGHIIRELAATLDGADDEQASEVIAQWDLDDEQLVGTVAASMSRMHVVLGV